MTSSTWPIAHRAQRVDEGGGRRVSQKSTSRSSVRMRGLKPGTEREGRAWRRGGAGRARLTEKHHAGGSVSESGGHRGKVTRAPASSGFSFSVFGKAFGREPVRAEEEGGWWGLGGGPSSPPPRTLNAALSDAAATLRPDGLTRERSTKRHRASLR